MGECGLNHLGTVVGPFEYGNKHSSSMKGEEFLYYLSDY
jgi:hypothetical protein